jgi:hypothetical protein
MSADWIDRVVTNDVVYMVTLTFNSSFFNYMGNNLYMRFMTNYIDLNWKT